MDLKKKVEKIIINTLELKQLSEIDCYQPLQSIGINSISFIKIVVAIEAEFGIEFEDDSLASNKFLDLDSLIMYIKDKTNQ